MQLCCPRCRSLVEVPDKLSRFFNMPVACHLCGRVFAVPPQSPLDDGHMPHSRLRPLDRSISAERCSHERSCPSCQRPVRIPGLDPAIGPLDLSFPYCEAEFRLQAGGGIGLYAISVTFGLGIVLGLVILWLDHEGIIALHRLQLTEMLLEWARQLRQWAGTRRWRGWYSPPSE